VLLEMVSEVLCLQPDLSHFFHGTTFDNKTIALGIEEESIGGTAFCCTILHLVFKSPNHSSRWRGVGQGSLTLQKYVQFRIFSEFLRR
jgi:hypothetical protein